MHEYFQVTELYPNGKYFWLMKFGNHQQNKKKLVIEKRIYIVKYSFFVPLYFTCYDWLQNDIIIWSITPRFKARVNAYNAVYNNEKYTF